MYLYSSTDVFNEPLQYFVTVALINEQTMLTISRSFLLRSFVLLLGLSFTLYATTSAVIHEVKFHDVVNDLCSYGDLYIALNILHNMTISAEVSHSIAALELLLHGDIETAILYHKRAKQIDKTVLPPLAKLHLG